MHLKIAWVWAPYPYSKSMWLKEKRDSVQYTIEELAKEYDTLFLAPVKKEPQKIGWMHLYVSPSEAFTALQKFDPDMINLNLFNNKFNREVTIEFKKAFVTLYDHGGNLICTYPKRVDIFFTAQEYRRKLIAKRNKVPLKKVVLNPYGADPKQFYPDDGIEKTHTGIMVGDFRRWKRQHLIIQNWVGVKGKLILCGRTYPPLGDTRYVQECRKLIHRLGLSERVKIQDFVPHDELPRIINSAEIGLHAGSGESGSRSVTEMMACGLPMVVVNDSRSNVEWVGRGGLKVTPNSIGKAVNHLKKSSVKYKALRDAALKRIKPYTYDRMLATFKKVIDNAHS